MILLHKIGGEEAALKINKSIVIFILYVKAICVDLFVD